MDKIKFYKIEWMHAEKEGNLKYANACKEHYRELVMAKIMKPYNYMHDNLRMYPKMNLN